MFTDVSEKSPAFIFRDEKQDYELTSKKQVVAANYTYPSTAKM
jgi:hypothetical protein